MSHVIVCREKHGDFYYAASTDEELAVSALKILTDRWHEGYWYYDPDELDKESQEWRPDELIWNILPEGHWPGWDATEELRVAAIQNYEAVLVDRYGDDKEVLALKTRKLKEAVRDYKHRREYRKWYAEAKALVESQDVSAVRDLQVGSYYLAWHLLQERSDHEYEGVELEPLQTAKEDT